MLDFGFKLLFPCTELDQSDALKDFTHKLR
jgi:hypothetical protein